MKRKKKQRETVMESLLVPIPYLTGLLGDGGRGIRNEEVESQKSWGKHVVLIFVSQTNYCRQINLVSKNLQSIKQKLSKEKDELKTEVNNFSSSVKSISTITEVEPSLLCIYESFFHPQVKSLYTILFKI